MYLLKDFVRKMLFSPSILCLLLFVLIFSVHEISAYKKSTLSDEAGKAYMDKHAKKAGVIVLPSGLQHLSYFILSSLYLTRPQLGIQKCGCLIFLFAMELLNS